MACPRDDLARFPRLQSSGCYSDLASSLRLREVASAAFLSDRLAVLSGVDTQHVCDAE
jgi:hypothetical protein